MPEYFYKGRMRDGKIVDGSIEADTPEQAKALIRERGLFLVGELTERQAKQIRRRISMKEVAIFSRQLAVLVKAGITVPDALETMLKQVSNPNFQEIIRGVVIEVRGGKKFSQALAKYPKVFPDVFQGMVEAGEEAGKIDTMLSEISQYYEGEIKTRSKLRAATSYPMFVGGFAILAALGILFFIFPKFETIYKGLKAPLPAITQFFLALSRILRAGMLVWPVLIFGAALFFRWLNDQREFRKWRDNVMMKLWIVGPLTRKVVISRFTKTLAVLHGAGVNIVNAVRVAGRATGNIQFLALSDEIARGLKEGQGIARPVKEKSTFFPPMVISMLEVGEKSGALEDMLFEVARLYDDEVDEAIKHLSSSLEPLLIGVLGGIIALLMLALYLPMVGMVSAVQKTL